MAQFEGVDDTHYRAQGVSNYAPDFLSSPCVI